MFGAGDLGELIGFIVILFLVGLAVYIYTAFALMSIAKRTNTPNPWLAWIPIANIYLTTQIAGVEGWWTLSLLLAVIPFVNLVGIWIFLGINVWWWWRIVERLRKPGWWGILTLIPIVNLVIMGILAWENSGTTTKKSKKKSRKR